MEIQYKSMPEIVDTLKQFPKNKIVFWIGAGIDRAEPTSLPLGKELLEFILRYTCGSEIGNNILKAWNTQKKILSKVLREIPVEEYPRLETVIEAIRTFESQIKSPMSALKGFNSFLKAPPNNNHNVLAYFLNEGSTIITTNYDDCIPKAYNVIFKEKFNIQLKPCMDSSGIYTFKSDNLKAGSIYHIHGVASHVEDLGASLSIVKNSLPKDFRGMLDKWIDDDYCFVFLGYGGVDALDVNRYFLSREVSKKSTGIYIRHCAMTDTRYKATEREVTLLRSFCNHYVCSYNTTEFIKQFGNYTVSNDMFLWEKEYKLKADEYQPELYPTLTTGIAYLLGINITRLIHRKWWNKVRNYNLVNAWYIDYYSFCAATFLNNRKLMEQFGSKVQPSELMDSDIAAANRDYKSSSKCLKPLEDIPSIIQQYINNNKKIGWDISTPLHRKVSSMLFDIVKSRSHMKKAIDGYFKDAIIIMDCFRIIIGAGYDSVLEVNQINTAYRALGLCEMIFNKDLDAARKYLNHAFTNYTEISSANGLAVTSVYYSIIHSFAYYYQRSRGNIFTAFKFGVRSFRIIIYSRLYKYLRHSLYANLLAVYVLITARKTRL